MNLFKKFFILLLLCSSMMLTSCATNYYSAAKPSKDGSVVIVGVHINNFFGVVSPRAWVVDINTGKKEVLEVEFE